MESKRKSCILLIVLVWLSSTGLNWNPNDQLKFHKVPIGEISVWITRFGRPLRKPTIWATAGTNFQIHWDWLKWLKLATVILSLRSNWKTLETSIHETLWIHIKPPLSSPFFLLSLSEQLWQQMNMVLWIDVLEHRYVGWSAAILLTPFSLL